MKCTEYVREPDGSRRNLAALYPVFLKFLSFPLPVLPTTYNGQLDLLSFPKVVASLHESTYYSCLLK